MAKEGDLFSQINNAVLDLQGSQLQTFERPLKTLARLLHHPDLEPINRSLTESVDFDAFMEAKAENRRWNSGQPSACVAGKQRAGVGANP